MFQFIIGVMVFTSVLMIGAVLVQKSKGGGLNQNFASQAQLMGVRKSTDLIEKATWGLDITLLVFSLGAVAAKPDRMAATNDSGLDQLLENNRSNMQTAPAYEAAQQENTEAAQ